MSCGPKVLRLTVDAARTHRTAKVTFAAISRAVGQGAVGQGAVDMAQCQLLDQLPDQLPVIR